MWPFSGRCRHLSTTTKVFLKKDLEGMPFVERKTNCDLCGATVRSHNRLNYDRLCRLLAEAKELEPGQVVEIR